jgi:rhodanese-related sulfurtransferase
MIGSGRNQVPLELSALFKFVENNALLFAVAVISGAMLLWPLLRRSSGGPWVSAAQATQLINREDALVVDVRDSGEYAAGHILGARNVPLARLDDSADLAKRKDKAVILYCDTGDRASKAAGALRKLGFEKVFNLTGGLGGWQQAGLPVEK